MTRYDLSPAFVRLEYHSAFGVHVQILPTREWSPPDVDNDFGFYQSWDASGVRDTDSMINDLCTKMAAFMPATSHYDNYSVWTQEDENSAPVFAISNVLDIDGTDATPGWSKAVQETWTFRDTGGKVSKLVLLDSSSGDSFDRQTVLVPASAGDALRDEFCGGTQAWASRAGNQPVTFMQVAFTLNETLRRQYHMF